MPGISHGKSQKKSQSMRQTALLQHADGSIFVRRRQENPRTMYKILRNKQYLVVNEKILRKISMEVILLRETSTTFFFLILRRTGKNKALKAPTVSRIRDTRHMSCLSLKLAFCNKQQLTVRLHREPIVLINIYPVPSTALYERLEVLVRWGYR